MTQRRQWHPTPVLLCGKSHGQRSLVCYSPWGHEEADMSDWLSTHPCMYELNLFSPVNLGYVNLIIRSTKDLRRKEKFSSSTSTTEWKKSLILENVLIRQFLVCDSVKTLHSVSKPWAVLRNYSVSVRGRLRLEYYSYFPFHIIFYEVRNSRWALIDPPERCFLIIPWLQKKKKRRRRISRGLP